MICWFLIGIEEDHHYLSTKSIVFFEVRFYCFRVYICLVSLYIYCITVVVKNNFFYI